MSNTANKPKISFREVMDADLALQFQQQQIDQEARFEHALLSTFSQDLNTISLSNQPLDSQIDPFPHELSIDDDASLALALQLQMEEEAAIRAVESVVAQSTIDQDHFLASHLQKAEYQSLSHNQSPNRTHSKPNTPSKVSLVSHDSFSTKSPSSIQRYFTGQIGDDYIPESILNDEEEPEDRDWDEDYVKEKTAGSKIPNAGNTSSKSHHALTKTEGRLSSSKYQRQQNSSPHKNTPSKTNSSLSNQQNDQTASVAASPESNQTGSEAIKTGDNQEKFNRNDSDDVHETVLKSSEEKSIEFGSPSSKSNSGQSKSKKQSRSELQLTSEGALDGNTRIRLQKLMNEGLFDHIYGCVGEGKEALVYYATNESNSTDCAVKIYKTVLTEFKDRDEYLQGEWRFKHQLGRQNHRKTIKLWAEKEMRNLRRIYRCGIFTPEPIALKGHILLMEFIGKDGFPAPLLQKVKLTPKTASTLYIQAAKILRDLYQLSRLVHGDFSEYALLVHEGNLCVIDLAQAVDFHHPNAMYFLKRDCENITKFFTKKGVEGILPLIELFKFVTNTEIESDTDDFMKQQMKQQISKQEELKKMVESDRQAYLQEQESIDRVFMDKFLPQSLQDVSDPVGEIESIQRGDEESKHVHHWTVTKMSREAVEKAKGSSTDESTEEDSDEDLESSSSEEDDESDSHDEDLASTSPSHHYAQRSKSEMTKEERKAHKKQVKTVRREKLAASKLHK